MASICKRVKSQFWIACYTDRQGRQLKRSTKTTDKAKALQIALEFERVERMARAGNLTTAQVKKVLSEVAEKVTGDRIEIPTVEAYFKEWMALVRRRTSEATVERYQNTIDLFEKKLGLRAKQPISTLTARHIEEFLESRLKSGVAPKTAVVDLKTLSTALRRAETHQLIPKNPVPLVQLPRLESSEREVFSEDEVEKLLDAAPDTDWQTIILLGYYAGCAWAIASGSNGRTLTRSLARSFTRRRKRANL